MRTLQEAAEDAAAEAVAAAKAAARAAEAAAAEAAAAAAAVAAAEAAASKAADMTDAGAEGSNAGDVDALPPLQKQQEQLARQAQQQARQAQAQAQQQQEQAQQAQQQVQQQQVQQQQVQQQQAKQAQQQAEQALQAEQAEQAQQSEHARHAKPQLGAGRDGRDIPDLELAAELALTCYELYRRTPAGLAPEIVHFANNTGEGAICGEGVALGHMCGTVGPCWLRWLRLLQRLLDANNANAGGAIPCGECGLWCSWHVVALPQPAVMCSETISNCVSNNAVQLLNHSTEIPLDFPNKHVHDVGQGDFSIKPNVSDVCNGQQAVLCGWRLRWGEAGLGAACSRSASACPNHPPGANPRLLLPALSYCRRTHTTCCGLRAWRASTSCGKLLGTRATSSGPGRCAALCCAALRCAALRCAALRCAVLCCAVLCCACSAAPLPSIAAGRCGANKQLVCKRLPQVAHTACTVCSTALTSFLPTPANQQVFRALEKWARVHPSDRGHACATCRAKVAARCAAAAEAAKAAGGSEGAGPVTAAAAAASGDVSGCPGELGGKEQCSSCSSSGGYTSLQSVLHVPPHRRDKASCVLPAHVHCWLAKGFQSAACTDRRMPHAIVLQIPLLAFCQPATLIIRSASPLATADGVLLCGGNAQIPLPHLCRAARSLPAPQLR